MKNKALRLKPKTREEWLHLKESGIGSSEIAAIVGLSPWMTSSELLQIKMGMKKAPDISDHADVSRGVRMEKPLRELFKADHPEYKVTYHQFDMLYQEATPFMRSTLDGEVRDGKLHGCIEIKTSTPNGKAGWEKWNIRIPDYYYVQLVSQIYNAGLDFGILYACLINRENDKTIREYRVEREEVEEDMLWIVDKAKEFWSHVESKTIPPMTILI